MVLSINEGEKITTRRESLLTCPTCQAQVEPLKKFEHFQKEHPEFKMSRERDGQHTLLRCALCQKRMGGFRQLIVHQVSQHKIAVPNGFLSLSKTSHDHSCPVCHQSISVKFKFKHLQTNHPEYKFSRCPDAKGGRVLKCGMCGVEFYSYHLAVVHFDKMHPIRPYDSITKSDDVEQANSLLDGLITNLKERRALLEEKRKVEAENVMLKTENASLMKQLGQITQKLVQIKVLMAQPER